MLKSRPGMKKVTHEIPADDRGIKKVSHGIPASSDGMLKSGRGIKKVTHESRRTIVE